MTAVVGEEPVGVSERISTMVQVNGALARMRRAGWPLAAVWLGLGVAYTATALASSTLGIDMTAAATPGYAGVLAAQALAAGLAAAFALRLMVSGRDGWLRIDGGLLASAGAVALLTFGFSAPFLAVSAIAPTAAPPAMIAAAFAMLVGVVVGTFAWLRLALWPAGLLFGRRELTAAQSWRLMRKASRGLLLGYVVFGVPLAVVLALAAPVFDADADLLTQAGTLGLQFATAGYLIVCEGLVATIYDLRVGRPSSLAEVFA